MAQAGNAQRQSEPELVRTQPGRLGRLTMNRPKVLNSLNLAMINGLSAALDDWRNDPAVHALLIDGAGERGLCAGGDVVAVYRALQGNDPEVQMWPREFWAGEYHMNAALGSYPKPRIALMDGITLGGGVGISGHGSHRVVTERSQVGMPEVGIGFVPDVGGSYLLSRAPGQLGVHMGLTGAAVSGADAIYSGLADYYVDSAKLDELREQLAHADDLSPEAVDRILAGLSSPPPASQLAEQQEWIDAAYSADTVPEILALLEGRPEPAAHEAAATIRAKSPLGVTVTLRALRQARQLPSLEDALAQEFRISMRSIRIGDFEEGVRAALVDKDRNPQWRFATIEEVPAEVVESFFAPLPDGELWSR